MAMVNVKTNTKSHFVCTVSGYVATSTTTSIYDHSGAWGYQIVLIETDGFVNDELRYGVHVKHLDPPHAEGVGKELSIFVNIDADDYAEGTHKLQPRIEVIKHKSCFDELVVKATIKITSTLGFDAIKTYDLDITARHASTTKKSVSKAGTGENQKKMMASLKREAAKLARQKGSKIKAKGAEVS